MIEGLIIGALFISVLYIFYKYNKESLDLKKRRKNKKKKNNLSVRASRKINVASLSSFLLQPLFSPRCLD